MADRFVLKQFAGSATNNGAFGAAQATGAGVQPVANIKDVQSLNAFEQGWNSATLTADKLPALEEMQGLEALLCKAIKENYSEGIPFWISGETYYQYSFVNYNGIIYYNTTGSYTANNPAIDTANWAAYNKVGTATVGTDDTPIYLNVGTPTAGKRMGVVAYDNIKTYNLNDVVLNVDSTGTVVLYLSLAANNTSALTDTTKWKKVSLGGGGEIGDIGFAPLGIDESLNLRRYLNGQVISQSLSPSFTTKVKQAIVLFPNLGTTESNWQSEKTLSKLGQCGKFVVDDTEGTIRLPAIVNPQGLLSLSAIGTIKDESLPNIKGKLVSSPGYANFNLLDSATGVFSLEYHSTSYAMGTSSSTNTRPDILNFSASDSSSTYQDDAPVQQEAIQYPYYIQVATGIEETLPAIREYKVNNSDFFGKSIYSDVAPDNASYLASNGQYNARTVYPDYYDWLVSHIGETITANGGKVVLSTGTITDYDFVVNQNDQTFRLPLLNGEEDLPGTAYEDLTFQASNFTYTAPANGSFSAVAMLGGLYSNFQIIRNGVFILSGYAAGSVSGGNTVNLKKGDVVISNFSQESGTPSKITFRFTYAVGNGTLYYYVGDTVQDASLINAGAVLNTLSGKIGYDDLTTVHCVVETYQSGTSWYRVYDDGWVEQGGRGNTANSIITITLLKAYRDTNYSVTAGNNTSGSYNIPCACNIYSNSQIQIRSEGSIEWMWQACGYGA